MNSSMLSPMRSMWIGTKNCPGPNPRRSARSRRSSLSTSTFSLRWMSRPSASASSSSVVPWPEEPSFGKVEHVEGGLAQAGELVAERQRSESGRTHRATPGLDGTVRGHPVHRQARRHRGQDAGALESTPTATPGTRTRRGNRPRRARPAASSSNCGSRGRPVSLMLRTIRTLPAIGAGQKSSRSFCDWHVTRCKRPGLTSPSRRR